MSEETSVSSIYRQGGTPTEREERREVNSQMKMEEKCFTLVKLTVYAFLLCQFVRVRADVHYYDFVMKEINVTVLCVERTILTVNGLFPGPEIRVHKGDTLYVNFTNLGNYGVTLHWHGVKQPRNPWSDGPVFITQCPILPGSNFTYEVIFSEEEGTLWWHAHSDWTRATVHGAIAILPKEGTTYPFPEPAGEEVIILGSWYEVDDLNAAVNEDLMERTDIPHSTSWVINGAPGDLASCSGVATHRWSVDYGNVYLLRIVNAAVDDELFFAVAEHNLTIVGMDAEYVKPFETSYIVMGPGQTIDALITANRTPGEYYMATRQCMTEDDALLDYSNGTAVMEYTGDYNHSSSPIFPHYLPQVVNVNAAFRFMSLPRGLANEQYPSGVSLNVTTKMFIVLTMNELCINRTNCNVTDTDNILATSMNNISWVNPTVDILEAYYRNLSGYYTSDFPDWPLHMYNYSDNNRDPSSYMTDQGTKVKVLNYNESVEIVFQGTTIINGAGIHPMHLHGYGFYVVGMGTGNFNNETDPLTYNLVDPPKVNTFLVPKTGWLAIRFVASNPGVWLWHCHLERHLTWGMDTVFIVKNGDTEETSVLPPPSDMPTCIGFPDIKIKKWNTTSTTYEDQV